MQQLTPEYRSRVEAALTVIAATPGYAEAAADLRRRLDEERIRYVPGIEDRGQATLTGLILLGPEAMHASPLGLAGTLIHERHHLYQLPLLKTASFWAGVFTLTPLMRRYERPAYLASTDFLKAVVASDAVLAPHAIEDIYAIRVVYESNYKEELEAL